MYYAFLFVIFLLTSIGFAFLQVIIVEQSKNIFNPISLVVAACVTFLVHYYHYPI